MDKSSAERLRERITREPGWRAETSVGRNGEWAVKGWQTGETRADATTFTGVYGWHYHRLKVSKAVRQLKALRQSMRRTKGY